MPKPLFIVALWASGLLSESRGSGSTFNQKRHHRVSWTYIPSKLKPHSSGPSPVFSGSHLGHEMWTTTMDGTMSASPLLGTGSIATIASASTSSYSTQIAGVYSVIQSWIDDPSPPKASDAVDELMKAIPDADGLVDSLWGRTSTGHPCMHAKRVNTPGNTAHDLTDSLGCISSTIGEIGSTIEQSTNKGKADIQVDLNDVISRLDGLKSVVDSLNNDDKNDGSDKDGKRKKTEEGTTTRNTKPQGKRANTGHDDIDTGSGEGRTQTAFGTSSRTDESPTAPEFFFISDVTTRKGETDSETKSSHLKQTTKCKKSSKTKPSDSKTTSSGEENPKTTTNPPASTTTKKEENSSTTTNSDPETTEKGEDPEETKPPDPKPTSFDCDGSPMCSDILSEDCGNALSLLQALRTYGTTEADGDTGACSATVPYLPLGCGVFVEGDGCQMTGEEMERAYGELHDSAGGNCGVCGAAHFENGCSLKVDYVSGCW